MKTQLVAKIAAWILLSGVCTAQTPHWTDVNEHVSADLDTFIQLFQNAHTSGFGITILGDSQETEADGAGYYYIPALGEQFFQHYGNVPKSGLVTGLSQDTGWLSAGDSAGELSSDMEYSLPSVSIKQYDASTFQNGLLAQVATDGYTSSFLPTPQFGYFNGHNLEAELIIRTRPNSGEAFWQATLTDDDRRSYSAGEHVGSGFTSINADRNKIEFASAYLGAFDLQDHNAIQVIARSAEANRTVDIAGVRFTNAADASGIAIQSFSKGGNTAERLLLNFGEADSLFKLLAGEDVIAIQLGTNDARGGATASEFKEGLRSIISNIRNWSGNASLPVILISDPDFAYPTTLVPSKRANFDLYPGVSAELAVELNNVLAVNTRLIAARNNWYDGSSDFDSFSDGIHYTKLGSESLAKWQVNSLLSLANRMTVEGTSGDDWVIFDPAAGEISVNGIITPIPPKTDRVDFFGEGGVDHVTSIGDPNQNEFVILQEAEMTVRTDDYFFGAHDIIELEFEGSSQSDTCVIYDADGDEQLTSTPTLVQLQGSESLLKVTNVGNVFVYSNGDNDSARMTGSPGAERVAGNMQNRVMRMRGDDFFVALSGFSSANANGGNGEDDVATMIDSNGSDIAYFRGDLARFLNSETDYSYRNIEKVNFSSTSKNDKGVFQKTSDSTVAGNGVWASLTGSDYNNNAFRLNSLEVREP